jgi:hypothetical protein
MPLAAHDVLAGPIVRRVEPDLVSVWVALRKPASVRLNVFRGLGTPQNLGAPIASVPVPDRSGVRGIPPDNHTLAIGKDLHIAVAMMEPAAPVTLDWGQTFSYDLRLTPDEGGPEVGLGELGLLRDGDLTGPDGREHAHLALGYTQGSLPSFVLPPAHSLDLRVAHGSCRRPAAEGKDTMPELDGLIGSHLGDPTKRIHMLFLTGDQIYADTSDCELGHLFSRVGSSLMAGQAADPQAAALPTTERLKVQLVVHGPDEFPVDRLHFPIGRRTHLLANLTGFTGKSMSSHALGLGEYCALYLLMWSNMLWPDLQSLLTARWDAVDAYRKKVKAMRDVLAPLRQTRDVPEDIDTRVPYYPAWMLLPPEDRAIDAYLTDTAVSEAWEGGDWAQFWTEAQHPEFKDPPRAEVPAPSGTDTERETRALLAAQLTPSWFAGVKHYGVEIDWENDPNGRITRDQVRDRLHAMHWFQSGLPRVRRALANVATYMIFDDHEVTDDWNINLEWARAARDSPLGRGVVRNGLVAYTLFQGWGNDPRAFTASGSAGNNVLRQISRLFFSDDGQLSSSGPSVEAVEALERHFDFQHTLFDPIPLEDRMRWDYRFAGSGFDVIVLDTRTWRSLERDADPQLNEPFSARANAALMTLEAMQLQIPADPPAGVGAGVFTIVVSAVPVFGFPPVESLFQPILNINDLAKLPPAGTFAKWRNAYEFIGRANFDPEPWGFVPRAFEALLERLHNRRCVIFVSGDVHYACTLEMSYWREPETLPRHPTRFVQITASAFLNQQPITRVEYFSVDLVQQIGEELSRDIERLGWIKGLTGTPTASNPVEPPAPDADGSQTDFNARVKYLMEINPILLPPRALPVGTRQQRPPDTAWRLNLVDDTRPDDERLAALLPPPLRPISDGHAAMVKSAADRHLWQVEHAPDRRWVWFANFGVMDFVNEQGASAVRHSLYSYDLGGLVATAQPYTIAIVPLEVPDDEPPPAVPQA